MVVVIPCFDEPGLLRALDSLRSCEPPNASVEIIVVINSGEHASAEVTERNAVTFLQATEWARRHSTPAFAVHVLHCANLPRKKAGVGLARKIGMDEALRRLGQAGNVSSPIICFDADCTCAPNYLRALEDYFRTSPESLGCSIYFEHPLVGEMPAEIYEAIALYELHLRYYVQGLRWAAYPFAFHTIGSSMAVRADVYCKQGGMNKRQAGEDFYFLHKVIPLGNFGDLTSTTVIASPRPSDRVPFGTGKAVRDYLETQRHETYPLEAFRDLREFFRVVAELTSANWTEQASEPLRVFLHGQEFENALVACREQSRSQAAFLKRFFAWFDGFRVMKFIHHARDGFYGSRNTFSEAQKLLAHVTGQADAQNPRDLLLNYRAWERENPVLPRERRVT